MADKFPDERFDNEVFVEDRVQEPRRFQVLLHNDDYTTMEFVVRVLCDVFNKTHAQATDLMLTVHKQGKAVCGVYTFEVAETKVNMVHKLAREAGYPLKCSMEEV